MTQLAQSAERPVLGRWQDGYEIPVDVVEEEVIEPDRDPYTRWTYHRVVVSSLASVDIAAAVAAQFDGDPDILAQAQAAAIDALAPQVGTLTQAVDTLILDSLGGI